MELTDISIRPRTRPVCNELRSRAIPGAILHLDSPREPRVFDDTDARQGHTISQRLRKLKSIPPELWPLGTVAASNPVARRLTSCSCCRWLCPLRRRLLIYQEVHGGQEPATLPTGCGCTRRSGGSPLRGNTSTLQTHHRECSFVIRGNPCICLAEMQEIEYSSKLRLALAVSNCACRK